MIGGNYAGTTAQIGLGALRRAAIPENQPNLGVTLAQSIKAYKDKQKADEDQRKYEAYQEALKSGDQEAIKNAQIDLDPEAYQKAMAEKEADELDFNRRVQLMDMQNRKSLELAAARDRITRQNAQAEMDRQNQAIDAALASGQITPEQAQLAKTKLALGNLVDFGGAGDDMASLGIDEATYKKEKAKNYLEDEKAYNEAKANAMDIKAQTQEVLNLLDQDSSIVGPFSSWNETLKIWDLRAGNVEQRRQWLEARGEIVNRLIGLGNVMVKYANDHGVTGINSLPEVERNTEGLTPNSSPDKIRGAIKALIKTANEIEQKQAKKLAAYKNSAGQEDVIDYTELQASGGE